MRSQYLIIAVLMTPSVLLGQVDIRIDPVKVTGGEIRFETNPTLSPVDPSMLQGVSWHTIGDGPVRILFDRTRIKSFESQGFFSYDFFIEGGTTNASGTPQDVLIKVQATPVGDFVDSLTDVDIHIKHTPSDSAISDRINLPVHSFGTKDFFTHSNDQIEDVYVGTTRNVDLELTNSLSNVPIVIKPSINTEVNDSLWISQLTPNAGSIRPQSARTVATLRITPRFWPSINAALFPRSSTSEHDKVKISFRYFADFGGQERDGQSAIRLRIAIPFWLLLIFAAGGSILGAVAALLLPSNPSGKTKKMVSIPLAMLLAIIGEILAILISYTNSKVVLFGLDLDARQILPSIVLGILIGLYGYRSADKYGEIFGLKLPTA